MLTIQNKGICLFIIGCLFIIAQCYMALAETLPLEDYMIIVGTVRKHDARILFDIVPDGLPEASRALTVVHDTFKQSITLSTTKDRKPKIMELKGLKQSTYYQLYVQDDQGKKVGHIEFQTPPYQHLKILSLSCDRTYEDNDTKTSYDVIGTNENYQMMVHLGDQIYADWLFKEADSLSDEELRQKFRLVYRRTFGRVSAQKVLRRGAHIMIPDDHDIINNVDREMTEDGHPKKRFVSIGKTVFHEYQHQLHTSNTEDPVYWIDENEYMEDACLFFLDTRYERAFHYDPNYPLWGAKQWKAIQKSMKTCKDSTKLFYTGIPLMNMDETMANIVFFAEKERYGSHADVYPDVDRFLQLVLESNTTTERMAVVSGDIHRYLELKIKDTRSGRWLKQIASSGISAHSTVSNEFKVWFFNAISAHFATNRVGPYEFHTLEDYLYKNYGVQQLSKGNLHVHGEKLPFDTTNQRFLQFLFDHFGVIKILFIIMPIGICLLPSSGFWWWCSKKKDRPQNKDFVKLDQKHPNFQK